MRAGRSGKNGAISAATREIGKSLAHPAQILLARLLNDRKPRAQARFEPADRGGDDIGHDPRALAAAENQGAAKDRARPDRASPQRRRPPAEPDCR